MDALEALRVAYRARLTYPATILYAADLWGGGVEEFEAQARMEHAQFNDQSRDDLS